MNTDKITGIINYIRLRKQDTNEMQVDEIIYDKDQRLKQKAFNRGRESAYQDIIFLLEDLQADPEFPIDEIINQIKN